MNAIIRPSQTQTEIHLLFSEATEGEEDRMILDWYNSHRNFGGVNILVAGGEWTPDGAWPRGRMTLERFAWGKQVARFWKRTETEVGVVYELSIEGEHE